MDVDLQCVWRERLRLRDAARELSNAADKIWDAAKALFDESEALWDDADELLDQADTLWREAEELSAKADGLWDEAVKKSYGNVDIRWIDSDHCLIDDKYEYIATRNEG